MERESIVEVEGVSKHQVKELIDDLNSIEGVKAGYYITESPIEFKEIFVPLIIAFGAGVSSAVVAHYIIKFLEKEKSLDGKPIVIEFSKTRTKISQGETKEQIKEKLIAVIPK